METQKIPIFFDFDDTIANTAKFKLVYWQSLSRALGIDFDTVKESYQRLREREKNGFSGPVSHMKELGISEDEIPKALVELKNLITAESSDLIFPEIKFLLESPEFRNRYDPRLITVGEPDFQRLKVEGSGVLQFFKHSPIYVGPTDTKADAIKEVIDSGDRFYLIDDKEYEGAAMVDRYGDRAIPIIIPKDEREKFSSLIQQKLGITIEIPGEERLKVV